MEKTQTTSILEERLKEITRKMTKSDLKVVSLLKEDPEAFTQLSINEIAEKTGTSTASVTRFVKKCGYEKLTDLKLEVSRSYVNTFSSEYENITEEDDIISIAQKVLIRNIEAINSLSQMLTEADLEEALNILNASSRIIFTGLGGSASVAQDGYHKFIRLGLTAELITDSHMQMLICSVGNSKDVIIVVSNEGANRELNQALQVGKQNGMKIIAITQAKESPLAEIADLCLYSLPRKLNYQPESLISRVEEYSLIDVLYVTYVIGSSQKLEENFLKISENLKTFKSYSK